MRLATSLLCAALLGAGALTAIPATSKAQASPSPSPSASASAAAAGQKTAFSVDIKDFVYVPGSITVPVGSTVMFKNSDSTPHTVTADDLSFDSKNLDQNQTWSHVFAKAGTYKYVCAYHAFMHGTVVVK